MFREMRRSRQALTKDEMAAILENCSTGVLAVNGDNGYPYTVPLNYIYDNGKIIFHCAVRGHKIESIKRNDKVCFCIIEKGDVNGKAFNTDYRSIIIFGRAAILTDDDERRAVLEKIAAKYSAGFEKEAKQEIEDCWNAVALVEINIEQMTGKKGSELV